jgi:hypothetical protein
VCGEDCKEGGHKYRGEGGRWNAVRLTGTVNRKSARFRVTGNEIARRDDHFEGHSIGFHHRKNTEAQDGATLFRSPANGKCDVRSPLREAQV